VAIKILLFFSMIVIPGNYLEIRRILNLLRAIRRFLSYIRRIPIARNETISFTYKKDSKLVARNGTVCFI
jgi:hypothetical protein